VLDEQFVARSFLDGTGDSLPVLRAEDQYAKDQQVQGSLEKLKAFLVRLG
jgi:hypothetical protein